MKTLKIHLENCYGIKKLNSEFDFTKHKVVAIYAPNGAMKTSFAHTFNDLVDGIASKDRIFPGRASVREITDESNVALGREKVFVIRPYDGGLGHTEKTSTLLVNAVLRKEYEELHAVIEISKDTFLKSIQELSGSKKDLEKEISSAFMKRDNEFDKALFRVEKEILDQKDAPYSDIAYDQIFDDKVLTFLKTKDIKTAITEYIDKYNEFSI